VNAVVVVEPAVGEEFLAVAVKFAATEFAVVEFAAGSEFVGGLRPLDRSAVAASAR